MTPAFSSTALEGRTALVTGCGRSVGIGAGIARSLARAGASVMVFDLPGNKEGLVELVDDIESSGGHAVWCVGDVTDQESAAAAVRACDESFGRLDILVNNAGSPQGDDRQDLADVPLQAWQFVMDVNLTGPFLLLRHALPLMRRHGYGRIVNISSITAIRSLTDRVAYSASKAGLLGLTTALAGDVATEGITVNAVLPAAVDTGRDRVAADGERHEGEHQGPVYSWAPVGRVSTPDDIASVVTFLATEAAEYLTGQGIVVDGAMATALRPG